MTVQKDQHNIASVHTTKVIKMIIVSPLQLQVDLNGTNSFSSFWTYVLFRCLDVCGPSRYSTESNSLWTYSPFKQKFLKYVLDFIPGIFFHQNTVWRGSGSGMLNPNPTCECACYGGGGGHGFRCIRQSNFPSLANLRLATLTLKGKSMVNLTHIERLYAPRPNF